MELKEERNVKRYETSKMIDIEKLEKEEPETFEDLVKDYPIEKNTTLIFNVKE